MADYTADEIPDVDPKRLDAEGEIKGTNPEEMDPAEGEDETAITPKQMGAPPMGDLQSGKFSQAMKSAPMDGYMCENGAR